MQTQLPTILVAEDDDLLRSMYEELFLHANYKVESFKNGALAFDSISKNNYDLVFTDYSMPLLTGVELLEKCRDLDKKIPAFILNTGHPVLSDLGDLSNFAAVLRKGTAIMKVLETVADVLARSKVELESQTEIHAYRNTFNSVGSTEIKNQYF